MQHLTILTLFRACLSFSPGVGRCTVRIICLSFDGLYRPSHVAYVNVLPTSLSMSCYSMAVASDCERLQTFWYELQAKPKNSYDLDTRGETILLYPSVSVFCAVPS